MSANTEKLAVANQPDIEKSSSKSVIDVPNAVKTEKDNYLVSFEEPNDPTNPLNWSKRRKWSIIALLSAMTLVV